MNEELRREKHDWQLDGTFEDCPQLFYPLFTFQCNVYGPLIIATNKMLPKEMQPCHQQLFAQLGYLRPKTLVTGFAVAMTNTAEKHFSGLEKIYCYFHLSQTMFGENLST